MEKFAAFKFMPPIPLGKDGTRVSDCEEHRRFSRESATFAQMRIQPTPTTPTPSSVCF